MEMLIRPSMLLWLNSKAGMLPFTRDVLVLVELAFDVEKEASHSSSAPPRRGILYVPFPGSIPALSYSLPFL